MLSWSECNLLKRLESKISKHTVIRDHRQSGSRGVRNPTWRLCSITTRPLSWQRSLKTSTLTMYHVSKMRMQTHWHPSLLHWPFQPEPRREYLSTVVTCTVANSPWETVELQEETFKSKSFLRLRQVSNLGISDSLTSTSSYMTYRLMNPKRQLPSEGKLLDSITMHHANIVPSIVWWNPTLMPFT